MISTYVEHYNSITTHVTTYKEINSEYIISIYKSEACLNELEPEIPIPDFSNCSKSFSFSGLVSIAFNFPPRKLV